MVCRKFREYGYTSAKERNICVGRRGRFREKDETITDFIRSVCILWAYKYRLAEWEEISIYFKVTSHETMHTTAWRTIQYLNAHPYVNSPFKETERQIKRIVKQNNTSPNNKVLVRKLKPLKTTDPRKYFQKRVSFSPSFQTRDVLEDIIRTTVVQCMTSYGMTPSEDFLYSDSRKQPNRFARQLCHYFGVLYQLGSLSEIGKVFGNKVHSTVLHSYRLIRNYKQVKEPSCYDLIVQIDTRLKSIIQERALSNLIKTDVDFDYPAEEINETNLMYQRPSSHFVN